jgi:hypothetical protein
MNTEFQAMKTDGAASASFSGTASLEKLLLSYSDLLHKDLSRDRFAEEREWYEAGLFYQRRQWLKWDSSNKRWSLLKQDPAKPRPMPVTNHFARTINANANQLGSGKLRAMAIPNDDSDRNRRAAEFAENAIDAIDEESGLRIQMPLLAKHTALWGLGVTVDIWDTSKSNGVIKVPQIEVQSTPMLGCLDCGNVSDLSPERAQNPGAPMPQQQQAPCPYCGSTNTAGWTNDTPVTTEVKQFSKGKITTEVRPIFELFIPRDCQSPNLAPKLQWKFRKPLSVAKQLWPDAAQDLKSDEKQETNEIYLEALRSLVNYNFMHEQAGETVTIVITWADFDQLPDELQQALEEAVQNGDKGIAVSGDDDDQADEPGERDSAEGDEADDLVPDSDLDPIEQLHQWGIFLICAGGKVLDWGISQLEGQKPPTFYQWEADPANIYNKGLGSDLIPLQKRLNRLDSLIELAMMSNAAGKWVWPTTQTTKPPSGSPSDVVEFDPIGDGKIAPTFVQPSPFHGSVWQLRAAIKQDFLEIGMTEGIQAGMNPQGVTAFRGLAYLGAKAAEQISTQRALWETSHGLRHGKCLILAKRYWSEQRKVKVAGYNGRYGMKAFCGDDLKGDYTLTIVENSSRPRTDDEKQADFAMLVQGGMINPMDQATRDYIINQANLNSVNLVDHNQFMKAERDLDLVIAGQSPVITPYMKLDIFIQIFGEFTLAEEFEQLPPDAQQRVLTALEMMQQQQAAAQAQAAMAAAASAGPTPGQKLGGAMAQRHGAAGGGAKKPGLEGVPGQTVSPEASSAGAASEASQVASQLP